MGSLKWVSQLQPLVTSLFNSLCLLEWPFARPWWGITFPVLAKQTNTTKSPNQQPHTPTPKNNQSSLLLGSRGVQSPYHAQASQHLACPSVPLNCVLKERTVEQRWNWALPCSMLVVAGDYSSPLGGIVAHILPLSFWWAAQPLHSFACCTCDLL